MESLERYRDKKRRRLFSGAKTIRYEKRKVNADRRSAAFLVHGSARWPAKVAYTPAMYPLSAMAG